MLVCCARSISLQTQSAQVYEWCRKTRHLPRRGDTACRLQRAKRRSLGGWGLGALHLEVCILYRWELRICYVNSQHFHRGITSQITISPCIPSCHRIVANTFYICVYCVVCILPRFAFHERHFAQVMCICTQSRTHARRRDMLST